MAKEDPKGNKATPPAEAPKPAKSKLRLILLVLVPALVVGAGGYVGWSYFKMHKANAASNTGARSENPAGEESGQFKKGTGDTKGKPGTGEGATLTLEPFLVNLADKDTSRYLKTTIQVLVPSKEVVEKISSAGVYTPKMRDAILSILTTKVADDVITPDGKQKLKKEIIEKLNEFLPEKAATDVFFTDFVVQL
jgi:flagellar FliL protein